MFGLYLLFRLMGWFLWAMMFILVETVVFEVYLIVGFVWLACIPFWLCTHRRVPRLWYTPKSRNTGRHIFWI